MMPLMQTPMSVRDLVLSLLLVLWCALSRAQVVHAPPGWYVNGARPDGGFELDQVLGDPMRDLDDARNQLDLAGGRVLGWLYCTGGATPRQNGIKVWCQR